MKDRSINKEKYGAKAPWKDLKTPMEESHNGAESNEKLSRLVKLLARIEAEKDFNLYLDSLKAPDKK